MAEPPADEMEQTETPGRTAAVHPPTYGETVGAMHVVEMMMQTQTSIGELKADVRNLTSRIDDLTSRIEDHVRNQQTRLGRVEKFMWVTTGGLVVIVSLVATVGWILRPIVDAIAGKLV